MNNILKFASHKILNENGNSYIFMAKNNAIFQIDDRTRKLVELSGKSREEVFELLKNDFTEQEFNNLLTEMQEQEFLLEKGYEEEILEVESSIDISSLTLMIIQECNLRCKYCYGEGGEYSHRGVMSVETAKKAIDFMLQNAKNKKLQVTFFGGEPLLNFPLIKEVVSYCGEIEKKGEYQFNYSMTTNGTCLNEEIEQFIIHNNIFIQISLDGKKEFNDKNRYYANHKGAYDDIISHTKYLRENYNVSVRATIGPDNLDLVDVFEHLYSLKFKSIAMVPAHNLLSEQDYEELIRQTTRFNEYYYNLIKNKAFDKVKTLKIQWQFLSKIHSSGIRNFSCGVGRRFYAIDIDGNIFPCQRFVSSEYKMGNIYEGLENVGDFLEKIKMESKVDCKSCWIKNICVGGCPNESYSLSGKIGEYTESYCKWNIANYENLLRIYIRLTEEEKKRLFNRK